MKPEDSWRKSSTAIAGTDTRGRFILGGGRGLSQTSGIRTPDNIDEHTHRIHGAAIYGNMDPINIPPMLAYIPYMDPSWDR